MADTKREVPQDFHALYDRGFRAARGTPIGAARVAATAGDRRLREEVPGLEVVYDEATQLPKRVSVQQPEMRLSARAATGTASPEEAVMSFIQNRGDLWNLSADDTATVEVVSVSRKGLPTVQLVQSVGGTEVFNA